MIMIKLNKIQDKYYTQNIDNIPIKDRVFFSEGIVLNMSDYRFATESEIEEWDQYKKEQEELWQ